MKQGRLRDAWTSRAPAPALAVAVLVLLALPLGWFLWRATPGPTQDATVAAAEATRAGTGPEEFRAAAPGEPEMRIAGETGSAADAIPDDDPIFDPEQPIELGFNDKGFPGFSEQELEGMPEPSLALEPVMLADPLDSRVALADAGEAEPEPAPAVPDTDRAPIRITALIPGQLPRYAPNAARAGGSLASLRLESMMRSAQIPLPRVQAMAPDHVAAVESATPTVYWWLSSRSEVPVEVTLVARDTGETLFERRFAPPVRLGLHALAFSELGVRLPQGRIVEWTVALVVDESRRELDAVANAALRFAPPERPFPEEPGREAHQRAAAGYWIDAFSQLTRWIEAEPEAGVLRAHRAALASQVGLEAP